MASSVNVALPTIGKEFALDAVLLSWVATSYLLAAAMFLVPMGRAADIYGRKRIFTLGVAVYTAASLALAFSPTITLLIIMRVVQGAGAAMTFGTSTAMLMSVYPREKRGHVLGIATAAVYIGLTIGPFVGGVLTEHLGWRSIFALQFPLGVLTLLLVSWKIKGEWRESLGERFDTVGSLIYAGAIVCTLYGFSILPSPWGGALLLAGIAGTFVFLKWASSQPHPVISLGLVKGNTAFVFSNLAALINYSATFAVTFLLSLYLQYIKGLGPRDAGIALVAQPALMAAVSPLAGRLSDRIEPRIVSSIGMALTCVALLSLAFIGSDTELAWIVAILIVLGIGFGLFSSPNANAVMSSVQPRHYGVAAATTGTMRLVGQMFSMGLAMFMFSLFVGHVQITPEYYPQFVTATHWAFGIYAAVCFAGVFVSLARGNVR